VKGGADGGMIAVGGGGRADGGGAGDGGRRTRRRTCTAATWCEMVRKRRRRRRAGRRATLAQAIVRLGNVPIPAWAVGADEILLSKGRTQLSVSKLPAHRPDAKAWLKDIDILQSGEHILGVHSTV
jgi:hypothetical protein